MSNDPIKELLDASVKAARALDAAKAVQWEKSPVPSSREDAPSRSLGGYSNPTADTALDTRRLAVREAVELTEEVLHTAARELRSRAEALIEAVERWQGL